MLIKRQQKMVDDGEAVRVWTVPGRTVRGVTYFKSVGLLVSPEFAEHLVAEGDVTLEKPGGRLKMLDWAERHINWIAPMMFVGDISTADVFSDLIDDLKSESAATPKFPNDTFMESHGINAPHVPTHFVKVSRGSPVQPRSDFLLAIRLADKGRFAEAREVAWRGFNAVCDNAPEYHSQR